MLQLLIACFSIFTWAAPVPYDLSQKDRTEALTLLGLMTSTKILGNPYPLGGYDGVEIGVSLELIDVRELSRLGCAPGPGCPNSANIDSELRLGRLTLSKGLFNNVDLQINLALPNSEFDLAGYGGLVRYSFYEARFIPLNLSLLMQGDFVSYGDRLRTFTFGPSLVAGFSADNLSLYLGAGQLTSTGTFVGGASSATDATIAPTDPQLQPSSNTLTETVRKLHTFIGASLHWGEVFTAVQLDRYPEDTLSARLGLRY